jgi:hypothetical protein
MPRGAERGAAAPVDTRPNPVWCWAIAALRGDLTEQYSAQFAVVTLEGRILYVLSRTALRGACHPEHN